MKKYDKKNARFALALFVISLAMTGCRQPETREEYPEAIFIDAYSVYILDPAGFEVVGPEERTAKEFLVLEKGGVQISFGALPGAFIAEGAIENQLANFSRETSENPLWLPGCHRYLLDSREISIEGKKYYSSTLLVRRNPDLTKHMNRIQLAVHRKEFTLFPNNEDRIRRMYYSNTDKNIYIFSVTGSPEDFCVQEPDILRLLGSIKYDATQAIALTQGNAKQ